MLAALLVAASAQQPCPELPLRAGTRWTYRAAVAWTLAGTATVRRTTLTWTTTVTAVKTAGDVTVALVRGWPSDLAWWEPGQEPQLSLLYCVRHQVYHLRPGSQQDVNALADSLLKGHRHPTQDDLILRWPLHLGELFGRDSLERSDTFYAWFVEAIEPAPAALQALGSPRPDSLYHLAYRSVPDHQLVDYLPGIGLTRYTYGHHGTPAEADAELSNFALGEQ